MDDPSAILVAESSWSVFDDDKVARSVTVGEDGSIYVTGGQGPTPADMSILFVNFWVARFSAAGELDWENIEVVDDDQSHGLSVALSPDGTLTTVATIWDGTDTPRLRQHDVAGTALGEFTVDPGVTRLATAPSGALVGSGSNLIEYRSGRPFTELWVGGLSEQSVEWQQVRQGLDGSISTAWDIALSEDRYFVAGSRGTAADSNASDAWLGAGTFGGGFDWETVPVSGGGNGRSVAVAVAADGGVVVAGTGEHSFVHRYGPQGSSEWERRLERNPSVVLATESGYAVGYADPAEGLVDFFDWDGEPTWRFVEPSCGTVEDLVEDRGDLIALLACSSSMGMFRIPIEQTVAEGR
jgi:hypothetical protein